MRVIIAGSRDLDPEVSLELVRALASKFEASHGPITVVLSGGARGVDRAGELFAAERGIPCEVYRAEWGVYGNAAGPRRNGVMVSKAEGLVCLHTGGAGSRDVMRKASEKGLHVVARRLENFLSGA